MLPRRGFTLAEMIATFVLLSAAISVAAPLLVTVSRQRVAIEQRQFAIQHAGNLLEVSAARPWTELPAGRQVLADAPADLERLLPELEQTLTVKELPEKPVSRQLTVSVRWRGHSGVAVEPVQLSAWVFQTEEQ
jgi:type II secretory pathway pseudopilin PulG